MGIDISIPPRADFNRIHTILGHVTASKFQSLQGLILTVAVCLLAVAAAIFQSLQGLILTFISHSYVKIPETFQSLQGLILTCAERSRAFQGAYISIPPRADFN